MVIKRVIFLELPTLISKILHTQVKRLVRLSLPIVVGLEKI